MEYVGRPLIFVTAAALDIGCIIAMLKWQPNPTEPLTFFMISGVWGIADGVWSPQIKGIDYQMTIEFSIVSISVSAFALVNMKTNY